MKVNISENQLKKVIAESVIKVLNEDNGPYSSSNINTSTYNTGENATEKLHNDAVRRKKQMAPGQRTREQNAYWDNRRKEEADKAKLNNYLEASRNRKAEEENNMKQLYTNFIKYYDVVYRYVNSSPIFRWFMRRPKLINFGLDIFEIGKIRRYYDTPENKYKIQTMDRKINNLKKWGFIQ